METIELVNDGTGLGFGIVGGKTTGVIVKTILPGGIADQVLFLFFFCFSLITSIRLFHHYFSLFFVVVAHTEFNNLSPLRMAACAAGTTSCGSGTPTCLAWAANKWPRSSGSVATGWSWWSPGVPWMKVPPSLPSCLWCCPLSANNRWGQQFKKEQVQFRVSHIISVHFQKMVKRAGQETRRLKRISKIYHKTNMAWSCFSVSL